MTTGPRQRVPKDFVAADLPAQKPEGPVSYSALVLVTGNCAYTGCTGVTCVHLKAIRSNDAASCCVSDGEIATGSQLNVIGGGTIRNRVFREFHDGRNPGAC